MESTNAAKGGNAYYNVLLNSFELSPAKDKDALAFAQDACALSESGLSGALGGEADPIADSVLTGAFADSGFAAPSCGDFADLLSSDLQALPSLLA